MTTPEGILTLGTRRELFSDCFLIDRMENTDLRLHHPVVREPAFRFDAPWEGRFSRYGAVFQDGDRFRLYYRGGPDSLDQAAPSHYCLAESRDGIAWEKPDLGLFEFRGSRTNNILFSGVPSFAPFLDTNPEARPDQRYKALAASGTHHMPGTMLLNAYASADGLTWRRMQEKPVLTKGGFDSLNVAFWSQAEGCYVAYYRIYSKTPDWRKFLGRRTIARATSPDFIHWSDPVRMEFGDTPTEELYTNATLPYFRAPHLYVALPKRYVLGRKTPLTARQLEDFQIPETQRFLSEGVFMTSRGGNRYDRTFMEAFFRPGPDPANWCSRSNEACWGILQTGPAEMSLYYTQHFSQPTEFLVRATLRLDGFASVRAGYAGGELVTKPFTFTGSRLELNLATAAAGSIRVEIQDADGKPFRDYGAADSYELYGDDIARLAKWHGSPDVSALAGQPVRLRIVMKDADLYSLKFS